MRRLGRLAGWWWRWMLLWTVIAGLGLVVLLVLPLTNLLPDPQVTLLAPTDGSAHIGLQQPLLFSFSTPMDANSVAVALSITPKTEGSWQWLDARTAQWKPHQGWSASTTYSIQLNTEARSKARQALPAPFIAQFSTVIAPTVERVWPTPGGRLLQTLPLVLHFDQAMQPISNPISLSPATPYTAYWSDPHTAMLDIEWQLGRSYSMTLSPIPDQNGIPAQSQTWSFDIAMPPVVSVQPLTTTLLRQSQPLSWTFAGILEPREIQAITSTIAITPNQGVWNIQHLATGRTEIGWHPDQPWHGDEVVALFSQAARSPQRWRWPIASPLGVVATLPGRDGVVVSNQEVRLVFSAAPEPALIRSTVAITPEVANLAINVVGTEATVHGDFSPNRAYTLTLPSVTPPLTLPFRVAAAPQILRFADQRPFRIWQSGMTPQIEIHADTLSNATAALYALDRGLLLTILRAEGTPFAPQRFGLEPLQTWTLSDTTHTTLPLPDLANGGYLFQVQGADGQRIQQVLVLSPFVTHLTTAAGGASAIVINSQDGTPAADVPLTLLSGGSQVAEGTTDAAGTWRATLPLGIEPDLLIGNDPSALVIATSALNIAPPSNVLTATILSYTPDRRQVSVIGHSRERQLVNLKVINRDNERLTNLQLPVAEDGVFSTTLRLSNAMNLQIILDDQLALAVPDPIIRHPQLAIHAPDVLAQGQPFTATVVTYQDNGLGLPAQQVEWRLIDSNGTTIVEGTANTNEAGSAAIPIDGFETPTETITLIAKSDSIVVRQPITLRPPYGLSIDTDKQLVTPAESVAITLTVVDHRAMPVSGMPVTVTISPDGSALRGTTDAAGRAVVFWRVPRNGAFVAQATSAGISSEPLPLWAATNGYRGWEQSSLSPLPLAVERFSILGGEPIRMLPLLQTAQGRAYLTWHENGSLRTRVTDWRAGQPVELALSPGAFGEHTIGIAIVSVENQRSVIRSTSITITQQPTAPLALQTIANATLLQASNIAVPTTLLIGKQISENALEWERTAIQVPVTVLEAGVPTVALAWNAQTAIAATLIPDPPVEQPVLAIPTHLQRGDHLTIAVLGNEPINLTASAGLTISAPLQQQGMTVWTMQALESGAQSMTWNAGVQPLTVTDPAATQQTISSRIITQSTSITASSGLIVLPSLGQLEQRSYAALAANPDPLAAAGRIAISQSGGTTDSLEADLSLLQDTRNDQNGWSWNGTTTDPLYTAMIMRLLATGTPTPDVQRFIERAERYLLQASSSAPMVDVALVVIQAKRGEPVQTEIERLLAVGDLTAEGQLMLIQALLDLRLERRATSALNAFLAGNALTIPSDQPWASCGLRSALLGQIVLNLDPRHPELPQILEDLGACWRGDGWGDPLATTEALILLQNLPQEALRAQSYRIESQGVPVYEGSRPFESTTKGADWTIIPDGPVIVASASSEPNPQPAIRAWGKAIALDPSASTIKAGDHVVLEWILLVEESLEYVDFNCLLPTGFNLEALTASGLGIEASRGRLQRLEPGIYTIHALVQPTFAGSLIWPTPIVTSAGQPVSIAAEFPTLSIDPQTP